MQAINSPCSHSDRIAAASYISAAISSMTGQLTSSMHVNYDSDSFFFFFHNTCCSTVLLTRILYIRVHKWVIFLNMLEFWPIVAIICTGRLAYAWSIIPRHAVNYELHCMPNTCKPPFTNEQFSQTLLALIPSCMSARQMPIFPTQDSYGRQLQMPRLFAIA